ncbi:hypothetical protein D3C75_1148570 [compost metagenome]
MVGNQVYRTNPTQSIRFCTDGEVVVLTFDLGDRIIVDVSLVDDDTELQEDRFDQVVDRVRLVGLDAEVVKLSQRGQIQSIVAQHLAVFVDRRFGSLDTDHSVAIHQTFTPRSGNRSRYTKGNVVDGQR